MSLVEFAENELNLLLKTCTDDEALNMQKVINNDILDIIKLFSSQGHSGFSAQYSLNILKRLMDYKPLSPITDSADEWTELNYDNDLAYQCKRCPSLFKDSENRVYNTEGRLFSDDNGHTWYNCKDSRIYVELPYTVPTTPEYVIIDNKLERNAILTHIINTVSKFENTLQDVECVDEDTLLQQIISSDKFNDLENNLLEYYHIIKPLYSLKDCDEPRMWNLINIIMKSDKEEVVKADEQ